MLWSLPFAFLLLAVVVLRYVRPRADRCPQCGMRRLRDAPLCSQCGWIYSMPDEDDEDGEEWGFPEDDPAVGADVPGT